jgi:two-component system NtrC family response regulator
VNEVKPLILIVDDDEDIRSQMKWTLASEFDVMEAADRLSGVAAYKERRPDVALVDLGLPPHPGTTVEGMALVGQILGEDPSARIIVISGQGEKENAMRAVGEGACDFFCKPVDVAELKAVISRTLYVGRLAREYDATRQQQATKAFEEMLGQSTAMQQVFSTVRKVAPAQAPVLILGESGTGKEVAAVTIHRNSRRADGPFVAINCGAIPEALLESELFGHERGSFTGAHAQRVGRFETAVGGTLFLDEVGELPLLLQVKLLRFLQDQHIERVGGRKPIKIDTRVIAATNVDLERAIKEGKFREDLFYRLAVVIVKLPPLRERDNDAVILAEVFLDKYAKLEKKRKLRLTKESVGAIRQYQWPGNVRELENKVKRAVIMASDGRVTPEDLSLEAVTENTMLNLKQARDQLERDFLLRALRKHNNKIAPAAAELGISRPTFYEMMEKLGIEKPSSDE